MGLLDQIMGQSGGDDSADNTLAAIIPQIFGAMGGGTNESDQPLDTQPVIHENLPPTPPPFEGGGGASPTDILIQSILGKDYKGESAGGASGPAAMADAGDSIGGGGGPAGGGLPPAIAAKVAANPQMYPAMAAILGRQQSKVTPRKPLDYLIAAASPLVAGLAQMMMSHRRSDRAGNFFAGLAGGGLNSVINEAGRGDRIKEANRQRMIEDILLQKKLRGTPVGGVDTETGAPKFEFETGETLPGIGKMPPAGSQAVPKSEYTDAEGNKHQLQLDRPSKTWVPSQMQTTDASGKKQMMPIVSPKQKLPPIRKIITGSKLPNKRKGSDADKMFLYTEGQEPVWTGLYDTSAAHGGRAQAEKEQANQYAIKALQAAHDELGKDGKKHNPEEYANLATELFRQASGTSKQLAGIASPVSTAIRNVGKSVKSEDELKQLLGTFVREAMQSQPAEPQPEQ